MPLMLQHNSKTKSLETTDNLIKKEYFQIVEHMRLIMNLEALNTILSPNDWTQDPEKLDTYGRDWTKHYTPAPLAIVFPRSTEDVQKIVLWARENKVAIVPSGGRTGLSAAAFATNGEVVVSLERMSKILDFNEVDQTITCQPGVITEQLQEFAADKGFFFPVDFAARGSSQIGGNIATNAGGIKVLRYGLTRQWVSSLTVVTGAGEVLELNKSLVKNATGIDLRHLFIGSEGTLGIITEATLNITREPKELTVFLLAVPELDGVMNIYNTYKKEIPLVAYEMFTDIAMDNVIAQGHVTSPLESKAPYYALLEIENDSEQTLEKAMELFEICLENEWVIDGTISQSAEQAKNIWRLREDISEALSLKSPYKNDISVRISKVPEFLQKTHDIIAAEHPDFEVAIFGHIGDGNLHVNILKPDNLSSDEFVKKCKVVDEKMFTMIESLNGSISAEHGVGLTKKPFLHHTRSPEEIAIMKNIKRIFDPDLIMNPGKVLDM